MKLTELDLLKKGFIKDNDHGIINFEYKIDEDKTLVITPQINEIFVWFNNDEVKVYLHNDNLDYLIIVAESIQYVE